MKRERIKKFFADKTTRIILLLAAALVLLFAVYKVFFKPKASENFEPTEQEERLSRILSKIDGVKDVSVMIGEEDGVAVSAVIVFEGADSILTRMRVLDAASGALGIHKEQIRIYPAES